MRNVLLQGVVRSCCDLISHLLVAAAVVIHSEKFWEGEVVEKFVSDAYAICLTNANHFLAGRSLLVLLFNELISISLQKVSYFSRKATTSLLPACAAVTTPAHDWFVNHCIFLSAGSRQDRLLDRECVYS